MPQKLRMIGDIYIEQNLTDGPGVRIAKEFLSRLTEEFARQSSKYIRLTNEVPFAFKERQLHSILAPALSRITGTFLMEPPVKRNWTAISPKEYNDSHGWVDYWVSYRNIVLIIELKHGFIASRTGLVNNEVQSSWEVAINQIKVIQDYVNIQSQQSNGAFRVALHVIPLYETVNKGEPKTVGKIDKLLNIQRNVMNDLKPQPNWVCLWKLHGDLVGPHEFSNCTQYFPGLVVAGWVSEICKK